MANTTVDSSLQVKQWSAKYLMEYVRATQFSDHMGTSVNSVIQVKEDLTKKKGDKIAIPVVLSLSGAGVTGDNTLRGNEESMSAYGHEITVNTLRNAVRIGKMEAQKAPFNIPEAARMNLNLWSSSNLRDTIIARLLSPVVDGTTAYASATETQKDAWLAANSDRVLFGAAVGNQSASDHSASLSNVDSAADILTPAIVSLAKRMAKAASPRIRPIRVGKSGEWYIMYCNSLAFRDFKTHSTTRAYMEYAQTRGDSNPLFQDGDIIWDGVILREVPEIAVISGVGATGINVAPNFLCGAQAVGLAWCERPHPIKEEQDYGQLMGVGVSECRGVEKLMPNSVQHGLLTVYASGVADT